MTSSNDKEHLLTRALNGEQGAVDMMLAQYRSRLKKMIIHRMDSRTNARFDPSDVVQDAIAHAAQHFQQFSKQKEIPLYPWLRKIAVNRLIDLQRKHIKSEKRSVLREGISIGTLSENGHQQLASKLVAAQSSPSEKLRSKEKKQEIHKALNRLRDMDREVLALRFLEGLTTPEAAHVLEISGNTFAQRLVRALNRFRILMEEEMEGSS